MDNRITKERVNIHLEYDWIKYIALLAAAVLLFALLYTTLAPRLKIYEEIKFLSLTVPVSDTSDSMTGGMKEFFKLKSDEDGKDEPVVKDVSMDFIAANPNDTTFSQLLSTKLVSNFDFVIAPVSYFINGELSNAVIKLTDWTYEKDGNKVPCIDKDADDEGARALGFKDAAQLNLLWRDAVYDAKGNLAVAEGYVGIILNGLENIQKLFTAIKPLETAEESGDGETAATDDRYALGILLQGGNIGAMNSTSKREKRKGIDNSVYNEALDALKYFIKCYSGLEV